MKRKPKIDMQALRWVLLNILWHSLPADAPDEWQVRQLSTAGASDEEIKRIVGN
jgi:hypothetical protein